MSVLGQFKYCVEIALQSCPCHLNFNWRPWVTLIYLGLASENAPIHRFFSGC